MNRLTVKNKYNIYYSKKKINKLNLSAKLGKLEDLEDELDCPLELILKALKYGIVYKTDDDNCPIKLNYHPALLTTAFGLDTTVLFIFEIPSKIIPIKDYKKTWWLTSDKEWKGWD